MRISDWSSDVCSSDLAVAGPHERNCNSRAARFLGPHRATCSQSLDIVASVLSSRWVSRYIAPTSGGAQGDRRAERSEERRAGEGCVGTCRSRGSLCHLTKNRPANTEKKDKIAL